VRVFNEGGRVTAEHPGASSHPVNAAMTDGSGAARQ
jgi:hypothetical protein